MHESRDEHSSDAEDLARLKGEARRRGVSLAQVLRELVAREAQQLRRILRPRFGIVHGGGRSTALRAEDEDAPARDSGRSR